jgi:hypothetical protein
MQMTESFAKNKTRKKIVQEKKVGTRKKKQCSPALR